MSFDDFKKPNRFVGMHAHDGYSTYDGLGYPADHLDFVLENGMDAFSITNHGNCNSLPFLWKHGEKLRKQGRKVRTISGCEFYFVPCLKEWEKKYQEHRDRVKAERDARKQEALSKIDVNKDAEEDEAQGGHVIEDEEDSKTYDPDALDWKRRYHLVVTARNLTGMKNLFRLIKRSYKEGFYRFPRIDFAMLKEHGEGLQVSSACLAGIATGTVFKGQAHKKDFEEIMRDLNNLTDRFHDALSPEQFFWEIQFNDLEAQHSTNRFLLEMAKRHNLPLIATADSHYPRPDLWEARELYKKLGWMRDKPTPLPTFEELKCELYPKNAEQMWEEYGKHYHQHDFYKGTEDMVRAAIERTHDLAWHEFEDVWIDSKAKLPNYANPQRSHASYPEPPEDTPFQQLAKLVKAAMIREGLGDKPEYVERVKEEMDDIKYLGFENYFLTMYDVFHLAEKKTLFGPARGSGGGSLVNYLLGITQIDPLPFGLLWSRFLGRHRTSWPDIDSDAGDRDALIDAARVLFGEDAVIPVSNFNTLKLKSIVKDVAKFYQIDFAEVNRVTGPLQGEVEPFARDANTEKSVFVLKHDDCMKYSDNYRAFMEKYPHVEKHVSTLFMEQRAIGRHAGGVLIADENELAETMPLIGVRGELQTPWTEGMNFRNLEDNGFIKFDFLGLTLMKDVENCIKRVLRTPDNPQPTFAQIKEYFDEHLNCRYVKQDDPKVWEHAYHHQDFAPGLFQFTAQGARNFCQQAKPDNIEELAAITAIYRPGPLKANVHIKYVEAKNDRDNIVYDHPVIERVLGPTCGFITFQEQFMTLAVELAGFTPGESDKMRKTLVKKSLDTIGKKGSERDQLRKQFVEGAQRLHDLDPKITHALFDKIEFFSLYGFNKSHAVAYAIDSYYAAWLYTYHPREWIATVLQSENNSPNGLAKTIREVKVLGYKFAPSDINYSGEEWDYNPERNAFIPPLSSIKGVGGKAMEEIIEARPFRNLRELFFNEEGKWRHSKVNKTCFGALCQIEAFASLQEFQDGDLENHRQLYHLIVDNYEQIRKSNEGKSKWLEKLEAIGDKNREEVDKIISVYTKTKMPEMEEAARALVLDANVMDWTYIDHLADMLAKLGHPKPRRQLQIDRCLERIAKNGERREKILERIDAFFDLDEAMGAVGHIEDWSRDEKIRLYQEITSAINNALVFPAEVMKRITKTDMPSVCEIPGGEKAVAWGCAAEIQKKTTKKGKEFYRIRMIDDQNRSCWLRVWGKFFEWGEERGQKIYYEPPAFSYWLMEVDVCPNWGASTAAFKMRRIPLADD